MMTTIGNEELLFGFETLSADAIDLDPDRIDRALELSQKAIDDGQQWQTYLHALALFGTQQWLEERDPELSIDLDRCSIFQPMFASPIDAVCNVRVGDFKLCILTVGSILEEEIFVPKAAIDLPEFSAHFYVLVEVCEELEQVNIRGFLRYDQLVEQRTTVNFQMQEDWTYAVPLAWFESDRDRLLLYLRCLAPEAIVLPAIPNPSIAERSGMQDELIPLLPQLQSARRPWWQILSWQQAAAILTHPELLESSNAPTPDTKTAAAWGQRVSQPIINTATWLRDELDRWAQEAAWVLLPPLSTTPSGLMRSVLDRRAAVEELEWMLQQLQQKGTIVNAQTHGAYQDFHLGKVPLRLYAVTWEVLSAGEPEWTLLLILSGMPDISMPSGVMLQVSDDTGLCVQRQLPEGSQDSLLYIRVIGSWNETFLAQISLPTGEIQKFPPFGFQPERG